MDKYKAMRTFVAIADEGSLTSAARALQSSLPAVVRALAAYETSLGARLFNRTTRRISLTEEGKQHLERSRQLLAGLDEAEAALRSGAGAPVGQLTITAPVLFGQMHVAPAVTRFVARHSGVRCSVVLLDRVVNLLEEGFDLGIRIGHFDDSSLVARPLGRIRHVVVAHPGYLRRHGTPRHPRDLQQANCLRTVGGQPAWSGFQDQGRPLRVPVRGNLEFNHVLPAVQACADGAGIGRFFGYQVAQLVAEKRLRIVLEDFEPAPIPLSAVYPHARLLPARTRALIDWLAQEITAFRQ